MGSIIVKWNKKGCIVCFQSDKVAKNQTVRLQLLLISISINSVCSMLSYHYVALNLTHWTFKI